MLVFLSAADVLISVPLNRCEISLDLFLPVEPTSYITCVLALIGGLLGSHSPTEDPLGVGVCVCVLNNVVFCCFGSLCITVCVVISTIVAVVTDESVEGRAAPSPKRLLAGGSRCLSVC